MKGLAAALVLLSGVPAFAQDELVGVRLREWFERMHGSIQSTEPPLSGDTVNLDGDLGLGEQELAHEVQAYVRIPIVGRFYAGAWWAHAEGDEIITRTFNYGGLTFTSSDEVKTNVDLDVFYLTYEFALPTIPLGPVNLELGIEAGARGIRGRGAIEDVTAGQKASDDGLIGLPVLGGHVTATFASWVRAEIEVVGLAFAYNGNRVSYLESNLEIVATPLPWLFAGVGYKFADVEFKRDGSSSFDLNVGLKGIYLTLGVRF